jgi:RNA polymerase sigma-70 factor (ECF subfamily)
MRIMAEIRTRFASAAGRADRHEARPIGREADELPTAAAGTRLSPQMHLDDADAVRQAKDGDEEAFRLLVHRHSRGLYRLAHRMTGQPADAEDVVQETFVRAYRQLDRFEARSNFATWLYRIGYNCAIDHLRARPRLETAEPPEVLAERPKPPTGPAVDDLVYAAEIGGRVQAALNDLTSQERAAFLLRHYEGCSIGEICGALGLNTSAAKHAVFRAVRKMRQALEPLRVRATDARSRVTATASDEEHRVVARLAQPGVMRRT